MLQVPCLSPPIYGHSHYKKFWLRQQSVEGGSSASSLSCCEMNSSSNTGTSEISSSGKRICGKRRSSPLKVALTDHLQPQQPHHQQHQQQQKLWKSSKGDGDQVGEEEEETPKGVLEAEFEDEEDDQAEVGGPGAETAVDCLTSKCNTDSTRHDHSASDSDSATSSTSQASDGDEVGRRSQSVKSSFRQCLKRQIKAEEADKEQAVVSNNSNVSCLAPKTRASSAALDCTTINHNNNSATATTATTHNNNNNTGGAAAVSTRTCKHCGTMKTPLWRNGPLGPKSLCNACGIRLRKARRNNEGGGGGSQATTGVVKRKLSQAEASSIMNDFSRQHQHPYKKSRLPVARESKREQQLGHIMRLLPQVNSDKSGGKAVSKDEEEGAVLLMALSCGLVLA